MSFISKQLKEFKQLEPSGEWKDRQWESFVAQADIISNTNKQSSAWGVVNGFWHHFGVLRSLGNVAVVVLVFAVSSWATLAAESTARGDILYPLKASVEKITLAVTFDDNSKAQKQTEYAGKRVKEIKTLAIRSSIQNVEDNKISETVQDLQNNIKEAHNSLVQSNNGTTQDRVAVARIIDQSTTEISKELHKAAEQLPAEVRLSLSEDIAQTEAVLSDTKHQALKVIITEGLVDNQVSEEDIIALLNEQVKVVFSEYESLDIASWEEVIEQALTEVLEQDGIAEESIVDPRERVVELDVLISETMEAIGEYIEQKNYLGAFDLIQTLQGYVSEVGLLLEQGVVMGDSETIDEEVIENNNQSDSNVNEAESSVELEETFAPDGGGETTSVFINPLEQSSTEEIKE